VAHWAAASLPKATNSRNAIVSLSADEPPFPGDSDWTLCPELAHPKARALFREQFFWDGIDDHAPWGSDEGSDALAALGKAHVPRTTLPSTAFIFDYVGSKWSIDFPDSVSTETNLEEFSVGHIEVIAIALGMYLLHGFVPRDVKLLGAEAIERELQTCCLSLFGEPEDRKRKLLIMKERLAQTEEGPNS
jgi:uncharacterized protein YfeS